MKTRQRHRGQPIPQNGVVLVVQPQSGPQISGVGRCPDKNPTKVEWMRDVIGAQQSDFNPCNHYKLIGTLKPLSYFYSGTGSSGGGYSFSQGGPYPDKLFSVLQSLDFLGPEYLDDFSVKAELHFKEAVADTSSLINFILELITLLEGNIRAAKKASEAVLRGWRIYWGMIQKGFSHWVAWNFAIRPTIRDVLEFLNVLKKAEKRLKFLKDHNHKPVKVKYRQAPVQFNLQSLAIQPDGWWDGTLFDANGDPVVSLPVDFGGFTLDIQGTAQVSSWAWVQWDIPDYLLDDFTCAIGIISMAMMGLYKPVKVIWEAIPFSWLIEWMTSKRAMLFKELANMSPLPDANILGTGYSIKVESILGEAFAEKLALPDIGSPAERISIGNFQWESFVRRPGLPSQEGALVVPDFSWYHGSIVFGIGANWRHRR